jgi:UDP-N-acetyl-D-mannosaminuronic acid dehydrogenase
MDGSFQKIVVIGMGYVGIPVAALFADIEGVRVVGIQRRSKRSGWKIDALNEGKCPIGGEEPGLAELIKRVHKKGTFRVTDDFTECRGADAILINVQTPVSEDGIPRYESLQEVIERVGERLERGQLICVESTVAPGTTDYFVKPILERTSGKHAGEDFYLAFAYERVMVGRLLHNIRYYPRIIGGVDKKSTELACSLYRKITLSEVIPTTALTAEVAKCAENTYRDVNIAFANEMALICESLGVNVYEVRRLVNTLPINSNAYREMHIPGAGVGGHCLPKDPWLLKYGLDTYGKVPFEPKVMIGSRMMNDYMPKHMFRLIKEALGEKNMGVRDASVCILGYAFLQNSDDTRNTPAYPLYRLLRDNGARVVVHDPYVKEYEKDINLTHELDIALIDKDVLALVTAHECYNDLDLQEIKRKMKRDRPIIVDGRDGFDKDRCIKDGFIYRGVGK